MADPSPSPEPEEPAASEPGDSATDVDAAADDVAANAADVASVNEDAPDDVPLNRAARRAQGRAQKPTHVGPTSVRARPGGTPRSHTKRRSG